MVLQFSVAYPDGSRYEITYVTCRKKIAKRYLRRWFLIDFISILPYDLVGFMFNSSEISGLKLLRMTRIVRILRLLKLLRLLKGMRILDRWQGDIGVSHRKMTLWGLLTSVIVAAHWISCAIGLASKLQGVPCGIDRYEGCVRTWVSAAIEDGTLFPDDLGNVGAGDLYVLALHTAVTIIVHPHMQQPTGAGERVMFVLLLLFGGFIWTRVISRSTAISTSLDRHKIHYQQTMDDMSAISSELNLSDPLRRRMRDFFSNERDASQRETWLLLTKRMSPAIRQAASRELNWPWVQQIPYLKECSGFMITAVTETLVSERYAEKEIFGTNFHLYILSCGSAMRFTNMFRVLRPGAAWGMDHLLLKRDILLENPNASAISFVMRARAFLGDKLCGSAQNGPADLSAHFDGIP
jgi:potassium voltage-gated channel Eag-related subfamily H protein 7